MFLPSQHTLHFREQLLLCKTSGFVVLLNQNVRVLESTINSLPFTRQLSSIVKCSHIITIVILLINKVILNCLSSV